MKTVPKLMLAAALTAALAATLNASAAEFTLLIFESPKELARRDSKTEAAAYWGAYNQFAGELAQAGVLRGGTALDADTSKTKDSRLGGYFVIDAADLATAKMWAAKAPAAAVSVEVLPHRANPTMAPK